MNTFEQHETWLKSNGKEGKQCDLNGASLNSCQPARDGT
jgi:hypothetical protein